MRTASGARGVSIRRSLGEVVAAPRDERRPTIHDDGSDDEESGDEIESPASGQPLVEFTDEF